MSSTACEAFCIGSKKLYKSPSGTHYIFQVDSMVSSPKQENRVKLGLGQHLQAECELHVNRILTWGLLLKKSLDFYPGSTLCLV